MWLWFTAGGTAHRDAVSRRQGMCLEGTESDVMLAPASSFLRGTISIAGQFQEILLGKFSYSTIIARTWWLWTEIIQMTHGGTVELQRLIVPFNNGGRKWKLCEWNAQLLQVLMRYIHNPPPGSSFSCWFSTFSMLTCPVSQCKWTSYTNEHQWLPQSSMYLHSTSHWNCSRNWALLA